MTFPDEQPAAVLDPLSETPLTPARAQAMIDVKVAGSIQPPGPGTNDEAVAELYRGMREADADLAARLESAALSGDHSVPSHVVHGMVLYTFRRTIETHNNAVADLLPTSRARLFGARNSYAVSYAQLALRDVDHMDSPDIADRLIEALDSGAGSTEAVLAAAWDSPFPIDLRPSR